MYYRSRAGVEQVEPVVDAGEVDVDRRYINWASPLARALVKAGPRRNPMALGFLLILIGEALAFGSPAILTYAVVLFLLIHLFVVLVEEPDLKRRFGASYEAYCRSVPRWRPRLSGSHSRDTAAHQDDVA